VAKPYFPTFLSTWLRRRPATPIRRRPAFRPTLETLEQRQAPAVLTVNSLADNTSADSGLTLREAIMVVDGTLGHSLSSAEKAQVSGSLGSNDSIQFSLPSGSQTITLTGGALSITRPMSIVGPGPGVLTINGNNADRIFAIGTSPNLSLVAAISGLTITGGNASSASIDHYGGGLLNFGTTTVSNCAFTSNTSAAGGAISSEGTLTINNCTFTGNTGASDGGAIYNYHGSGLLTVNNSTFLNNTSGSDGGGIRSNVQLVLNGCTFSGNVASSQGGGFSTSDSHVTVTNCTFVGNTAGSEGGGIEIESGTRNVTLVNDTVTANRVRTSTSGAGGGIRSDYPAVLENTLVAGNTRGSSASADDIGGSVSSSSSFNLTGTGGSGGLSSGNNNLLGISSPGLGTLASNGGPTPTVALQSSSPAIDHGSNAFVTSGETDQRGLPRVANGTVDIGAFEVQSTSSAASLGITGLPTAIQAGVAVTITVTAQTTSGATATGYTGTVHLTSSDPQAVLPADYTFVAADNGVHTFTVTLKTAGSRSVGVSDTAGSSISGAQASTTVTPAAASVLALTGFPTSITAGNAGSFTVTAMDAFGNTATGYTGTEHFSSSDAQAILPADSTLSAGVGTFNATLQTPGTQSLTATDTLTASITGTQSGITDTAPAAGSLTLTGVPSATTAGAAWSFTVTARDTHGNIATGYTGTVHFSSSDSRAVLAADYAFTAGDNGVHTFSATLVSAATQSLTVTDSSAGLSVSQSGIVVSPAAASTLVVSGFPALTQVGQAGSFTVTARDSFGNTATGYTGTVHFTSSDSQAVLPTDATLVGGSAGFSATLKTAGVQSLTATDTLTASITGTQSGITVNPVSAGTVLTVNSLADSTTADNVLTLREAILLEDGTLGRSLTAAEQAQVSGPLGNNDSIQFSLPAGPQTITLTGGALQITHAVTIAGPGAANLTINAAGHDRVFLIGRDWSPNPSLVVAISGLSITGGNQTYGGGLLNFGTLTVSNTAFANNTAGTSGGGGVYNVTALTLNNCTFTGNTVTANTAGGGINNISSGTVSINNCTFTGNSAAGSGSSACSGAAVANSGTMTVTESTFTGNTAASDAGAIYNNGTLTVSTTTFNNNTAGSDGGAIRSDGTLTLSSSTFAGNSASSVGGGLDSSDARLSVTNCTFAGNTAGSAGAGIQADSGTGTANLTNDTITANRSPLGAGINSARPVTLHNTIVGGNFQGSGSTASDIAGSVDASSSFNLIGTGGSGGLTNGVNNNLVGVTNLGLAPLANNGGPTQTIALLAGSPAIDHGSNTYVTTGETDQRGLPRIADSTVDIGAYEAQ
jgi:predicted outer membrane repeat protein